MTFETYEEGVETGAPASLFRFQYGSSPDAVFFYTDADDDVVFGGDTYTPIPIGRSEIQSTGNLDGATLKIETTRDAGIAQLYQTYPPSAPVTLTIRQGHVTDPDEDYRVVWVGRVLDVERADRIVTLNCEPAITGLRKTGLRRNYQYLCPHVLYGAECQASEATATVSVLVASALDETITLSAGWEGANATTDFQTGFVRWTDPDGNTQIRTTLQVSPGGLTLTVDGDTAGLSAGSALDVVLGCNHQESHCADLHNNIVNFGGQPWIPSENPVGAVNRFY